MDFPRILRHSGFAGKWGSAECCIHRFSRFWRLPVGNTAFFRDTGAKTPFGAPRGEGIFSKFSYAGLCVDAPCVSCSPYAGVGPWLLLCRKPAELCGEHCAPCWESGAVWSVERLLRRGKTPGLVWLCGSGSVRVVRRECWREVRHGAPGADCLFLRVWVRPCAEAVWPSRPRGKRFAASGSTTIWCAIS